MNVKEIINSDIKTREEAYKEARELIRYMETTASCELYYGEYNWKLSPYINDMILCQGVIYKPREVREIISNSDEFFVVYLRLRFLKKYNMLTEEQYKLEVWLKDRWINDRKINEIQYIKEDALKYGVNFKEIWKEIKKY